MKEASSKTNDHCLSRRSFVILLIMKGSMMKKLAALGLLAVLVLTSIAPAFAQDKVTLTWYIGLGTGAQPEQQEVQEAVVEAFNNSQDRIEVVMNVVENSVAYDTLSTLIAAGNAPDIIGPVGTDGSNGFGDSYLDLTPYVEGYDLSIWPEAAVDFYRTDASGLIGLPLATYPSMTWYRPDLFDEAGLNPLPANYGDPYVWEDGTEAEWNIETMTELAKILTVDANGNDATMEEFDPENIVQWGFDFQWYGDGRQIPTMFGNFSLYNPETGEAEVGDAWRAGFQWWYDGMWTEHFIPNAAQEGSDLLAAGNVFDSGNVAMANTQLWYTCCVQGTEWDIAPVPSYNGETIARLHADTFRIYEGTEHPEEAVEFLYYLVTDASLDLLGVYGGMPAIIEDQPAFFDGLDETYTQGVNWQVALDGVAYADVPSHEAWFPNYLAARDRVTQFVTLLNSTPDLDVQAELDALQADLQTLFDEAS